MSILWNFDKYAKIEELPFDPLCINDDNLIPISDVELLLKAGTPLVLAVEEEDGGDGAKGAVKASHGGSTPTPDYTPGTVHICSRGEAPTCFAAEDYHFILTDAQQPKLVKCVTKGYIEKAKVLAAMGAEKDPTADWAEGLAALGLYLVDDLGNLPGGGSGDGIFFVGIKNMKTDKTWAEVHDAHESGKLVVLQSGGLCGYLVALSLSADYAAHWLSVNSDSLTPEILTTEASSEDGYMTPAAS